MQPQGMPESLVQHAVQTFQQYQMYPPPMDPSRPITVIPWQGPNGIPPQHLSQMMPRDDGWGAVYAQAQPSHPMQPTDFDYTRYRDTPNAWGVTGPNDYYGQPVRIAFLLDIFHADKPPVRTTVRSAASSLHHRTGSLYRPSAFSINILGSGGDGDYPRSQTHPCPGKSIYTYNHLLSLNLAQPAPPTSSLVVSRGNVEARSPAPPTRVIKSTYGGNLFTADDVLYLKRYIDYCQEQGLVLR